MQQTLVSELPILLQVTDISLRLQWISPCQSALCKTMKYLRIRVQK